MSRYKTQARAHTHTHIYRSNKSKWGWGCCKKIKGIANNVKASK